MSFIPAVLIVEGASVISLAYFFWKAEPDPNPGLDVWGQEYSEISEGISQATVPPVESWQYWLVKRTFDVVFSLIMLALFVVPGCLIAALIAVTSEGPVFYREMRIGRYGKLFQIWKFRSMFIKTARQTETLNHADGMHWRLLKCAEDPRITRIGKFLRKWSLDEIPQLLNVLLGNMSLVGPRPIVEAEITVYGEALVDYLAATPGLSGLWQVSGRSNIGYAQRAKLDARYVRDWTLKGDLQILLRTIPVVLKRIGAQ
ncbi:MAG TPA: sugar transferase [Terracidiphilus sp.]|jgi:lipopolysaccharide/colanic/teichoic acid biosynthesis glycosyltransferase